MNNKDVTRHMSAVNTVLSKSINSGHICGMPLCRTFVGYAEYTDNRFKQAKTTNRKTADFRNMPINSTDIRCPGCGRRQTITRPDATLTGEVAYRHGVGEFPRRVKST